MQEIEQHYKNNYERYLKYLRKGKAQALDDAEDIIQMAYLKAVENWKEGVDVDKFVTNKLHDALKSHNAAKMHNGMTGIPEADPKIEAERISDKNIQLTTEDTQDFSPDPEKQMIRMQLADEIMRDVEKKPSHIERVLKMHLIDEMDYDRVARETGKAYQTVRNIISRFRKDMEMKHQDSIVSRKPVYEGPDKPSSEIDFGQTIQFNYNPDDWPVRKRER